MPYDCDHEGQTILSSTHSTHQTNRATLLFHGGLATTAKVTRTAMACLVDGRRTKVGGVYSMRLMEILSAIREYRSVERRWLSLDLGRRSTCESDSRQKSRKKCAGEGSEDQMIAANNNITKRTVGRSMDGSLSRSYSHFQLSKYFLCPPIYMLRFAYLQSRCWRPILSSTLSLTNFGPHDALPN